MSSVSAIIPAYNAERWVGRAIESVLHQTVRPTEIIVVDDGSTDATSKVVRGYGETIRYFHQENAGPAVARNRGVENAASEWVAFLDADDEWLPRKMEWQLSILNGDPGLKWCGSAREEVRDGITSLCSLPDNLASKCEGRSALPYFPALFEGAIFTTSGLVIHRSIFDELGGFDPAMRTGQDEDMWCRIGLMYPSIGFCANPCWRYHHVNPNSVHREGRRFRDLQLKSLCRNMRRATELGPSVLNEFRPYARLKAVDYLIRSAGRECLIASSTVKETEDLFGLTLPEHLLLCLLKVLPRPIALRLVGRLSL